MSLATQTALEFKSIKTDLDNGLNKDLSNLETIPLTLINQIEGLPGLPGPDGASGSTVITGLAETISKDINGNYEDNKSIYIKPSTNVAYYKTTEGWIEVGKLMVQTGNNKSIACGQYHTLFLLQDGTVKSVGDNQYGQLGDGTTTNKSTPVVVLNITNCIGIAGGYSHTVFLLQDGTCKAVGRNDTYGGLGDGTVTSKSTPVVVLNISNCIGIACGYFHTVFLLSDGTCKAVGFNQYGQLGNGRNTVSNTTPVVVLNVTNCISIACGYSHTVFLLQDGTCKAVGLNDTGQLGDGTLVNKSTPVVVLNITNCIGISCGENHTTFLLQNGTCKAVGGNTTGQLGDSTLVAKSTPVVVLNITNCISIAGGYFHTVFLLQDGTCKAVGRNTEGQLGDGTKVDKSTPVIVLNISGCISIACGNYHTVFLLSDGTCKATSGTGSGTLGDGTGISKYTPLVVLNISNVKTNALLTINQL